MATRQQKDTTDGRILHLAFELSNSQWKLGFTTGLGQKPRERGLAARDLEALGREIARAKRRFGLASQARVVSCFEAGRDGFWLHRFLVSEGIENVVVDSSSIEVKRRAHRAKSDRLDVRSLLRLLVRYHAGETKVWGVVRVPTLEEEDRRQLHRELMTLKRDRTRVTNRIKGLLAGQGVRLDVDAGFAGRLEHVQLFDGGMLPPTLRKRLEREYEKVVLYNEQIRLLEAERRRLLRKGTDAASAQARQLSELWGIGENGAWLLVMELFSWRKFRNRREVGAITGLVPSPYQSGETSRELGIAKAGNRRVRALAIELAWGWLRYQPESQLTLWYQERFAAGSRRMRKVGIVALARRLLIELWRYLETGVLPEGAELKPAMMCDRRSHARLA